MKTARIAAIVLLLAGLVAAQEGSRTNAVPAGDLLTELRASHSLGLFASGIISAGPAKTLHEEEGPFTLFAVRNQAFANLPKEDRETLMTNPGAMHFLLAHYVVRGNVNVEDSAGLESAR